MHKPVLADLLSSSWPFLSLFAFLVNDRLWKSVKNQHANLTTGFLTKMAVELCSMCLLKPSAEAKVGKLYVALADVSNGSTNEEYLCI